MKLYDYYATIDRKQATKDTFCAIRSANPHNPQALHSAYRFDFCAPFEAFTYAGNFTINQIEKIYNPRDGVLLAIIESPARWRADKLNVIRITGGNYVIDEEKWYRHGENSFDDYFRKSDVEDDRKNPATKTHFIYQRREYLCEALVKPSYTLNFTRFSLDDINYSKIWANGDYTDKEYIYFIKTHGINNGGAGVRFDFDASKCTKDREADPLNVFDRSGYYVYKLREALKNRLEKYKKDKKLAELKSFDATEIIENLQKLYKHYYTIAMDKIITAETYTELDGAYDIIRELRWDRGDLDKFIKKCNEEPGSGYYSFNTLDALMNNYKDLCKRYTARAELIENK